MGKVSKVYNDDEQVLMESQKLMEQKIEKFDLKEKSISVLKEEIVQDINHGLFEKEK